MTERRLLSEGADKLPSVWIPDEKKLVKICLHSQGKDVETPWAEDLGPAAVSPGARFVRLGNVPFLHAKPTYGDVLVVVPDPVYNKLTWDREGLPFERIRERIVEDGGRYTVIIDYELSPPGSDPQPAFSALDVAGENANVNVEGCFGPTAERPGRAYFAVPYAMSIAALLAYLDEQNLPMSLRLVHPVGDPSAN